MYFYASLFAALIVTLLVVSKVAKMLLAKRYSLGWIFAASLVGAIFAALAHVLVSTFVEGVEPLHKLILSIVVMFIVASAAFKYLNKMSWSSAITTNVASIAVGLIAVTAAVVLNGKSFDETLEAVNMTAKSKVAIAQTMAEDLKEGEINLDVLTTTSDTVNEDMTDSEGMVDNVDNVDNNDVAAEDGFGDDMEPKVSELDLIPPAAVREIKQREKIVYKEPKYRSISVGSIRSVVGKPIRILKRNGTIIAGSLKKINGSQAYIAQRLQSGVATTPISIAKIRKLEVYR